MKNKIIFNIILAISFFAACTKMDDKHRGFIVTDGIVYAQKATGVIAYSGNNRVQLTWALPTDPNVKKAVIYYNNNNDSVLVNMSNQTDSVRQIISNLSEGPQTFVIKTFDDKGNSSIPVEVNTRVYGDKFTSELINRYLIMAWFDYGKLTIDWGTPNVSLGTIATEVTYTTSTGASKTITVQPTDKRTVLTDYKQGTPLQYRTLFGPSSYNLDVFYSPTNSETVATRMNRSGWAAYSFSTQEDRWFNGTAANILDGNLGTFWHSQVWDCWGCHAFPHWIKIRLSPGATQLFTVEGVVLNARDVAWRESFRDFKIMGNDGTGWFDIKAYQMDENKGNADQVFMFSEKVKVKYLQIYMTSNMIGEFYAHFAEFNAYGY